MTQVFNEQTRITNLADLVIPDTTDSITTQIELLEAILIELRVITSILNEGLNAKEDIDTLRSDEEKDL